VGELGHQEATKDEFLTYILRPGRIRGLTLALAVVMELELPMTHLRTAACHCWCYLPFGPLFSRVGARWMGGILHSVTFLIDFSLAHNTVQELCIRPCASPDCEDDRR
jgi:hypothetical protein